MLYRSDRNNLISGIFLICIVLGTLYFFSGQTSNTLIYYVVLIVVSLAAALITNRLTGTITYKGKEIGATGSYAVFVIVLSSGITFQKINSNEFTYTVFLRDKNNQTILKDEGEIEILFSDNPVSIPIDKYGQVTFKGIPSNMKDKKVIVQLINADKYQFENKTKSDTLILSENSRTLFIQNAYCCLTGSIFHDNMPFSGVEVWTSGAPKVFTDSLGHFEINLPQQLMGKNMYNVNMRKGNLFKMENLSPMQEANIIL